MKLKGKRATRENMFKIVKKEGRIGAKKIEDIQELKKQDKLLEAFFSILSHIQWQLQSNFHNKFHVNWENIHQKKPQSRNVDKLWKDFTKSIDKLYTLIFISYSTSLINKGLYSRVDKIRQLRNQIAHNLNYYEPEIFVTRKEVRDAIEKCIKIDKELETIQHEIVFLRK